MLEIKDCYFIKEVHKIIFHPEIRFFVSGLFKDLSLFSLWGHTEPRNEVVPHVS